MTLRVGLVGCGAWGTNLLRVVRESPRAALVAVADPDPQRRARASALAPAATVVPSLDDLLAERVDAVLIAAPPPLHAGLVLRALAGGADVFVEKPLATRVADAERCAARAAALGRVAMAGHLLRYHPTVEHLITLARAGALGAIRSVESARLSTSGDRTLSAIWALGPHDVYVLQALDPAPFARAAARAGAGGDPVVVDAELVSGVRARFALSRLGAMKERRLRVVGSLASVELDDVRAPDRLVVTRGGSVQVVAVPWEEPLAREVDHFLACVEGRARPRTSFDDAVAVVRALAQIEEACAPAAASHAPSDLFAP